MFHYIVHKLVWPDADIGTVNNSRDMDRNLIGETNIRLVLWNAFKRDLPENGSKFFSSILL